MERREDIRTAMQNLLSPTRRPDARRQDTRPLPPGVSPRDSGLPLGDSQLQTLRSLQAELRDYGITADLQEIIQAMLEALTSRPALCRGLIAASLMQE